ncbi:MAG: elongation factor P--(R)-beta-lysine ligase [Acidobacteriota bacterium]|nr:MAG: elongation factor P--(R)-beta-lysine ligase [Acidobacteriota bacterium]
MSPAPPWQPTAPLETLRLRAELLARIRGFFDSRGVLEVETPVLGQRTVTDPYIESIRAGNLFLQTSPEYAMKRLLAAGSGPIFQICKAFRAEESGSRHNPEFTMLEWYRPGFDHHDLMDEVALLLKDVVGAGDAERETYEVVFQRHVGSNPHEADAAELERAGSALGVSIATTSSLSREDWLNLLMAQVIEPKLGQKAPIFVYDYPADLAALARIRPGEPPVAERFEVYFRGTELANGYHELTDAREQRERFRRDIEKRRAMGYDDVEPDERLLRALEAGVPASAGVALGLDRLVMVAASARSLRDVLSFPSDRA